MHDAFLKRDPGQGSPDRRVRMSAQPPRRIAEKAASPLSATVPQVFQRGAAQHPGEGGENVQTVEDLLGTALGQETVVAFVHLESRSRTQAAYQMSHPRSEDRRLVGHLLGMEKCS